MSQSTTTKKILLTADSSYTKTPNLQTDLRAALIANSSIPTIQSALSNELQRTGWSANLRAYVTALMRSGECTNYEELMERVLSEALGGSGSGGGKSGNGADGEGEGGGAGLRVPESVKERGVKVVKGEIGKVVDVEGEDGDA